MEWHKKGLKTFLQILILLISVMALKTEGIFNGDVADFPNFLYQAVILAADDNCVKPELIGSGALISDSYALSAAHLFIQATSTGYELKPMTFYVLYGTPDWTSRLGKFNWPKAFYFHRPNPETGHFNLAVIKLSPLPTVGDRQWNPINVGDSRYMSNRPAFVSSYGVHSTEDSMDGQLRYAEAYIAENSQCDNMQSSHICIKMEKDENGQPRGLCKYDAGAPFVVTGEDENYLIGIAGKPKDNCDDTVKGSQFINLLTRELRFFIRAILEGHSWATLTLENRRHQILGNCTIS